MDKRLWILSFLAIAPLSSFAQTTPAPAPASPAQAPAQAPGQKPPATPPAAQTPGKTPPANSNPFSSGPPSSGTTISSGGGGDTGGGDFFGGFGDQTPPKPAWTQFKLPNKTLTLNFKNASIDSILAVFSKASGITIIKDPTFTQTLSLYSPKPLKLADAFNLLNETLRLRNFELQKKGNLLEVVAGGGNNGRPDFGAIMRQFQGGPGGRNQPVLKYYPIQYASASAVAKTINDVFTGTSTTPQNPFGGGFRGGFQQQFQIGGTPGQAANQNQPQVHASADDFSNTVIVNAPQNAQDQIDEMLKAIDKQAQEPYTSVVYKLQYASSDDLASVVQNVLTANAPTGRGGGAGNVDPFQRFQQAARLGSAQASFGTVVSEPRSNSLVVTGTPENQTLVKQVIGQLDQPIKFEDSAFVLPLSSAKADQVAYVINQAFQSKVANTSSSTLSNYGQSGTSGPTGLNRFTNSGATRLSTPTGLADPNAAGNGLALNSGGGATPLSSQAVNGAATANQDPVLAAEQAMVQQAIGDPTVNPDALQTSIAVQGGFFNQLMRGGGQNSSQQTAPTQARDSNGNITNVHNLTGNVTVIPDVNSNSVIVVTNPENMTLVREILDQLDRTPAQVMIQAIIVEATLDKADKFGIEWSYLGGKFGTIANNTGLQSSIGNSSSALPQPGLTDTITNGKLTAFLEAVSADTRDKVLATPRIFAANNNAAEINISQSVPYETGATTDSVGNITYSYSFENVGIVLDVVPQITANGVVTMQVQQTANNLEGYQPVTNAPIVNQRSANTVVSVKDGETVVLGGIIEDEKQANVIKIPLLGDIPIIGNLFRNTVKQDTRTELLIFLTPHVVANPGEADKVLNKNINELSPDNRTDVKDVIKKDQQALPPKEGGH
jgi:general secretion pathway protein D